MLLFFLVCTQVMPVWNSVSLLINLLRSLHIISTFGGGAMDPKVMTCSVEFCGGAPITTNWPPLPLLFVFFVAFVSSLVHLFWCGVIYIQCTFGDGLRLAFYGGEGGLAGSAGSGLLWRDPPWPRTP